MQTETTLQSLQSEIAPLDWAVRTADSVMRRYPVLTQRWHYEPGVVLSGLQLLAAKTGDTRYSDFIRRTMDSFVNPDGSIRTYLLEDYNLDQINQGKLLFKLYETTGDERYRKAAQLLHRQLQNHPRNPSGGFWHKLGYPHQMWLDGIYMAQPFHAQFAQLFNEPAIFDDVTHQIVTIAEHTYDSKTSLLYHGWDATRVQPWSDPVTGCSANFWGRAVGWYMMGLVDVLDFLPTTHSKYEAVRNIFHRTAAALIEVQDSASGLWYQVLDKGHLEGNYLESSASSMYVYAFAKGVRMGYLESDYLAAARKAYQGLLNRCIEQDQYGLVHMHWICSVAGLDRNRTGLFDYYLSEQVVTDDYKGVGSFILAGAELES